MPSKNHTNPIKKDSVTGNKRAIKKITKFISVIFGAIGSGVGMLRYADTHKSAANNAHITIRFVESSCFDCG